MIQFTESNNTKHTLKTETLNRVELSDNRVRVAFLNEVLLFTFDTDEEASKIYQEITKQLK